MAKGKRVPSAGPEYIEDTTTPLNNGVVKEIIIPGEDAYGEGGSGSPIREGVVADIQFPGEDAYGSTEEPTIASTGEIPSPEATPINVNTVDSTSPINQGVKVGPQNANLNYNDYGDDSSPENQSTPGGLREKNTGEGVANSNIAYNPNADINNMGEYKYGEAGRQENAKNAGYLARRNDEIASALYNAGLVEKSDIIQYLSNQPGWMDSTEADRVNTVEAIWKRLGEKTADTTAMEENIRGEDTSGTLYGKNTANEGNPEEGIPALSDENSVFRMMEESRIAKVKELLSMSTDAIAAAIYGGELSEGTQQIRDYKENYPQLYEEVQTKLKQFRGQNAINNITKGETDYVTDEVETKASSLENDKINKAEEYSSSKEETQNIVNSLNSDLETNQSVTTAEDTMAKITDEMNKLKTRLKNLKNEANEVFKGDVPDYIVKAYINNRTQEINDRLQELQYNYDMAYQRNRDAIDDAWKWREYGLKQDQLNLQKEQEGFDQWYKKQTLKKSNIYTDKDGTSWELKEGEDGSLYYEKIPQIDKKYTIAERNNNPTNMTVGFMEWAGAKKGVDYVASSDYFWSGGKQLYYAKLLGDPIETTIKIIDNAIAAGKNPFNKVSWSYIDKLDINTEKWNAMSHKQKSDFVTKWLQYEGGNMNNMAYYLDDRALKSQAIDIDSIEIPDSIYDNGYMNVDPNSELGKKLKQDYIEQYMKESGLVQNDSGDLIPDADGKDTAAYKVISSDGETPISYRQRIYNLVPATLKNNEVELKNLYEIAKQLYKAKYSADEASMVFYGLDPRDDTTGLLKPLVYIARASSKKLGDDFYGNLGSLLESGNAKQAIRLVENSVLSDKEREKEQQAVSIVSKIQSLESKLQNAEKLVGPIDKPLNKLIEEWFGNEEYAQMAADIQNIYGQIRNELLGANITEGEVSLYIDMFPSMEDKVSTIKRKLISTKNAYIKDINAIRTMYDLPKINQYTLVDYALRANLYNQSANA